MTDQEIIMGLVAVGIPKLIGKLANGRPLPPVEVDPTGSAIHVSRVKIVIGLTDIREPRDLARVAHRVIAAWDALDSPAALNAEDLATARAALTRIVRRGGVDTGAANALSCLDSFRANGRHP